jgi:hypothetical protein
MSGATSPLDRRLAILEAEQAEQKAPAKRRFRPPSLVTFVSSLSIEDKAGTTGNLVRFNLWPQQVTVLKTFKNHSHVFVAKARQVGLTACALGYALHSVLYVGHREALIIRTSQVEANDAIRRVASMHDSIPPEMQAPRIVQANASRLVFENKSRIVALPATEKVARGHAAHLLICDEFAFWPWQEEQLNAASPAASRVLIISTGNGPTDYAYQLYMKAEAGESEYVPVFLPWSADPRRTQAWRDRTIASSITPRLCKREYPEVSLECWTAPSGLFFEIWDPARHVVDARPVPEYRTMRCIDWGITTAVCLWLQVHPSTKRVSVVGELVCHDRPTPAFCQAILDHEATFGLATPPQVSYCDPAGQGRSTQTASTEFEVAKSYGLRPVAGDNQQHDGCVRILNALAEPEHPLVVASSCTGLIRAFATVTPDSGREDIYSDSAPGDTCHLLDSLRYGLSPVTRKARFSSAGSISIGKAGRRRMEF